MKRGIMTTSNQPPAPQMPQPNQPPVPVQLPTRTPAVVVTIIGLVLMLLIAPFVFFGGFIYDQGTNIEETINSGLTRSSIQNGAEVSVETSGIVALEITPPANDARCTLTRDGQSYEFAREVYDDDSNYMPTSTVMSIVGVDEGKYEVQCEGLPDTATLTVVDVSIIASAAKSAVVFIIWATVVGGIGFVMMVAGLIWLVVINRQRARLYYEAQARGRY